MSEPLNNLVGPEIEVESDDASSSDDEDEQSDEESSQEKRQSVRRLYIKKSREARYSYAKSLISQMKHEMAVHFKRWPKCYQEGHFWIYPQDSFFNMNAPKLLDFEAYLMPKVLVWLPDLLWRMVNPGERQKLSCESCGNTFESKGFALPRDVGGLEPFILITRAFWCQGQGCGRTVLGWEEEISSQLPLSLQLRIPCKCLRQVKKKSNLAQVVMLSKRSGMSVASLQLYDFLNQHGVGSRVFSELIQEEHAILYDLTRLAYLEADQQHQHKIHFVNEGKRRVVPPFDSLKALRPVRPSAGYIASCWMKWKEPVRPLYEKHFALKSFRILKVDDSFKVILGLKSNKPS